MLSVDLWMPLCKELYSVLEGKQAASPLGRPKYSRRGSWWGAPHLLLNVYLGGAFLCYESPSSAGNQHFTKWLWPILKLISFITPFSVSESPDFVLINSLIISKPHLHPNQIYIFVPALPFILNNSALFLVLSVLCTDKNHNFSFKFNSYGGLFVSLIVLVWFCTSVPLQDEANISWVWMSGLDTWTLDLDPSESKVKIPIHIKYRNY